MIKFILLVLTIIIPAARAVYAQPCELTDLSEKFNFRVTVFKSKEADDGDARRISQIRLQITAKTNKKLTQRITVTPDFLFQDAFTKCSAARSYVTNKNAKAEAVDNDYGDFIVADLNFDTLEDFAVKRDSGGNGGAFYEYYIQNKRGAFLKDSFLTDEIGYFPGTIDARRKRLITYIHANAFGYNENIYKYNSVTQKWTFFKQTYRPAGN